MSTGAPQPAGGQAPAAAVDTGRPGQPRAGSVTDPPTDPASAALMVALGGVVTWLVAGALLAGAARLCRRCLHRGRFALSDRDWQRIEPLWSGR
jgi:hypothetical protein